MVFKKTNSCKLRSLVSQIGFMCVTAAVAMSMPVHASAQTAGSANHDIKVKLSAYKLEVKDGKEKLIDASKAKPGDVIEYRVAYVNAGVRAVSDVSAVLPIPVGTTYIENSARPREISARSREVGSQFFLVPLTPPAVVDSAALRVPASSYGDVRWQLKNLAAGEQEVVSARVRLLAAPAASADQAKSIVPMGDVKPAAEMKK